ncbi:MULTISPECIES: hypothetical protein [Thermomonospora]|uniref:Prenyltransferase n=1 Tax=Thermomonospora curvata (strain ATCC 19995 / DSM 43183 / JCM 3096 / KCTC 9072 / NBRC 15933 / NCIMB 10081 / Henssen B9) TaxID=471852 RepID=D1A3N4_THECD|nr:MULTISPECIES: hypothetical protein [Thermomonospora]ACY96159.1 hypothetical protein Tcur_0562 [Thermomonospora curvata DSM 43183]PKK15592.1 MAG: hypothetical protein BUE48_002740 [Thermomonospora sp. CIF 1]
MTEVDLSAAASFMAAHARILDRRRFQLITGEGDPSAVLAALDGYRNPDGGYGWGLEPDLRSPESQPAGALHALEVYADAAPAKSPHSAALCDWLEAVSLPDGGLPFALPVTDPAGCAPWWVRADPATSSLHITAAVAGMAHRVAATDPAVAEHPWLARATDYCLRAIDAIDTAPPALELMYALQFLDAVHDTRPEAPPLLTRLGAYLPADGILHVEGGTENEALRPLDFAPLPGRPVRALFPAEVVAGELRRLAAAQQGDGGWPVEYTVFSPASGLEWRGYLTVRALWLLSRNR